MRRAARARRAKIAEPALRVGLPGGAHEREADRAAAQVLSPESMAPRLTPIAGDGLLRRAERGSATPIADSRFASGLAAQTSGGVTLAAPARAFFEPRFGRDLSGVRVHEDAAADILSRRIGAKGFAHGQHIFLRSGQGGTANRRLMAHELAHTLQQGQAGGTVQREGEDAEPMKDKPEPPAPTTINLNFTGAIPVPPTGTRPLTATSDQPATTKWALTAGSVPVAAGTSISTAGRITVGAGQKPGTITIEATNAAGAGVTLTISFSAHPTGIDSTSLVSAPAAGDYGHVFDHVLTSSSGTVSDLAGIGVGEKFPNLATPNAATHDIVAPAYPFGPSFTLHTATLTADASNNWFATAAGGLGGTFDTVSIGSTGIDVGRFVRSTSNPNPTATLPQGFSVEQHLHWYNPMAATNRWTDFRTVIHKRELINTSGALSFVTTVNGLGDGGDAYTGNVGVTKLAATPATTPKSATAPATSPAPAARTVALSVDSLPTALPAGQTLNWSIQGADLGCSVAANASNSKLATLTIGTTAGTVTVRVSDSSGTNFDEIVVTIT
jgi:hypothetical protein